MLSRPFVRHREINTVIQLHGYISVYVFERSLHLKLCTLIVCLYVALYYIDHSQSIALNCFDVFCYEECILFFITIFWLKFVKQRQPTDQLTAIQNASILILQHGVI